MSANVLTQLNDSRFQILGGAVDDRDESRHDIATIFDVLLESQDQVERLYRSTWEHATSGDVDPVESGNGLFASWDGALSVLRQWQSRIDAAERAGELPAGSGGRLSGMVEILKAERDKAHGRWLWLTPADAESAEAEHARGETISNEELLGELQRRLASRGAG